MTTVFYEKAIGATGGVPTGLAVMQAYNNYYAANLADLTLVSPSPVTLPITPDPESLTSLSQLKYFTSTKLTYQAVDNTVILTGNFKLLYTPSMPGQLWWIPSSSSPVMNSMMVYDATGKMLFGVSDFTMRMNNMMDSSFMTKAQKLLADAAISGNYDAFMTLFYGSPIQTIAYEGAITNQTVQESESLSFKLPIDVFGTTTSGLQFKATANGKALPKWLSFDGATQTFTGTPLVMLIQER